MKQLTATLRLEELLGLERVEKKQPALSLDESALIERSVNGDDTAFDQIVSRYEDMVYNLALRLLGGREEALDLSQEVFFQVYRKLGSFRRDSSLRTWIYRIAINRAKNHQRWWRRREPEMTAVVIEEAERDNPWVLSAVLKTDDSDLPDETLQRKEMGELLHRAIAALPFDQRSILLLKEIDGLSYEEISRTLNLALGTVKSRLARARKALRQRLDPELVKL